MLTTSPACAASKADDAASGGVFRRRMRILAVSLATAVASAALLVSCGGGGGNGGGPPQLRALNAACCGQNAFDVTVTGASVGTGITYTESTALTSVGTGAVPVVFNSPGTTTALISTSVSAAEGFDYTVIAIDGGTGSSSSSSSSSTSSSGTSTSSGSSSGSTTTANTSFTPMIVAQSNATPPNGFAHVVLANADPSAGPVDFYVTRPSTLNTLPGTPTVTALTYEGTSGGSAPATAALSLTAGSYRIFATTSGTTTVVFDSGPVTFANGTSTLLAMIQVSGSASPFALLAAPLSGGSYQIADQRVLVRAGNFSPTLGTVDFFLDPIGTANGAANGTGFDNTPFATGVSFGKLSSYVPQYPGSDHLSMTPTGGVTELLGQDVPVSPATSISVYAIGTPNAVAPFTQQLLVVQDNLVAPINDTANLRIVQLAPDLPAIDVVAVNTSGQIVQRIAVNLTYPGASAYVPLSAGSYQLGVVATNTDSPILPTSAGVAVSVTANAVSTVVIEGCQQPGAGVCAGGSQSLKFVSTQD